MSFQTLFKLFLMTEDNSNITTATPKKTILIIDDEVYIRKSSKSFLEDYGFKVIEAESLMRRKSARRRRNRVRIPGKERRQPPDRRNQNIRTFLIPSPQTSSGENSR